MDTKKHNNTCVCLECTQKRIEEHIARREYIEKEFGRVRNSYIEWYKEYLKNHLGRDVSAS